MARSTLTPWTNTGSSRGLDSFPSLRKQEKAHSGFCRLDAQRCRTRTVLCGLRHRVILRTCEHARPDFKAESDIWHELPPGSSCSHLHSSTHSGENELRKLLPTLASRSKLRMVLQDRRLIG